MRRITIVTMLILTAALIPACASNKRPGSGAGAEDSTAGTQTAERGSADSPASPEGAEKPKAEGDRSESTEVASNEGAGEAERKQEGPCSLAGKETRRITFAKGETETTATGTMNGFEDEQVLLIDMHAGQDFRIEDVGDNPVTLVVCDPDGKNVDDYDLSCHGRFKFAKTKKGDYRVFVTECKKADPWKGEYKLKVTAVDAD